MFNRRPNSDKGSLWAWHEAQGGPERVDVITMSFGGNDIGFAEVVVDCLTVPDSWRDATLGLSGCDVSEEDLTQRIDWLLDPRAACSGLRSTGEAGFDCDLDLGDRRGSIIDFYYDMVTQRLTDRGRLYVVGYPRLFAPVQQWPGWIKTGCQGVKRGDTEKMGRVAGHFNVRLVEAVDRTNEMLGEERVVFVDRLSLYADGKHELCGTNGDWLNGLAADRGAGFGLRQQTSFHPNKAGHAGVAEALAEQILATFPRGTWSPGPGPSLAPPPSGSSLLSDLVVDYGGVGPSGDSVDVTLGQYRAPESATQWVGCEGTAAYGEYDLAGRTRLTALLGQRDFTPAGLEARVDVIVDGVIVTSYYVDDEPIAVDLELPRNGSTLRLQAILTSGTCTSAPAGYLVWGNGAVQ